MSDVVQLFLFMFKRYMIFHGCGIRQVYTIECGGRIGLDLRLNLTG